jgi:hypothetical protein
MKNYKRKFAIGVMAMSIMVASTSAVYASFTPKDVDSSHWAYNSIKWGVDNGVISGYEDGTFKPDNNVTGNEFVSMFVRAIAPNDLAGAEGDAWASTIGKYVKTRGWTSRLLSRNFTRYEVAQVISAAEGTTCDQYASVQMLLDSGLSHGKTDASLAGYNGDDLLTRAEALTFIKNAATIITSLKDKPSAPNCAYITQSSKTNSVLPTVTKVTAISAAANESGTNNADGTLTKEQVAEQVNRTNAINKEITDLAQQITTGLTDEVSKTKAIHDWVAKNIAYDSKTYNTVGARSYSAIETLHDRKAECNGYARLTAVLNKAVGLKAKIVDGDMIPFPGAISAHSWVEVYAGGRWIIEDTTLDAGYVVNDGFVFKYSTKYFDPTTKDFATDHTKTTEYPV